MVCKIRFNRRWTCNISITNLKFFYVYNYQILNYNAHWRATHKLALFFTVFYSSRTIYHYRKEIVRANLFDEYVQMRADELIKQNEPLLKSECKSQLLIKT